MLDGRIVPQWKMLQTSTIRGVKKGRRHRKSWISTISVVTSLPVRIVTASRLLLINQVLLPSPAILPRSRRPELSRVPDQVDRHLLQVRLLDPPQVVVSRDCTDLLITADMLARRKAPASSTSASPAIPPRHSSFFNSWLSTQPDRPTGASIVDTFKPPSAAENRVRERNAHSAAGGPSTSRTRQDRAPSSSASRPSNAGPSTTRPRGPDEVQRAHRDGWQSQVDALREEADVGEAERKRREKRRLLDKVEELKRQYRR